MLTTTVAKRVGEHYDKHNQTSDPSSKRLKTLEPSCNNPLCDHKNTKRSMNKLVEPIITRVETINDLIMLGQSYHCKRRTTYNGRILCNLVPVLTKLNDMIGLSEAKTGIVDQIMYFLRGFHNRQRCNSCYECDKSLPCLKSQNDMLHTVITGVPGVGKTQLGKILGEIYKELGILSNNTFRIVSRADLVAQYLGQTAVKTQGVINSVEGGVLFIDEAYSLGNGDSYSKECLDTLNKNLTEKRNFLCIIAGYKDALDTNFFNTNEGLRRRFTFRYDLKPYTHKELYKIFELKMFEDGWYIPKNLREQVVRLFETNYKYFVNMGGDIETLFLKSKIAHSRMCNIDAVSRELTIEDIETGIKQLIKDRDSKL